MSILALLNSVNRLVYQGKLIMVSYDEEVDADIKNQKLELIKR